MMAQYPDVFIMTFSIHIPNFVLLSQTAQLLLIFCCAAPLHTNIEIIKINHCLYQHDTMFWILKNLMPINISNIS